MSSLFQKLQLKPGMRLTVSGAPPEMAKIKNELTRSAGTSKSELPSAQLYFVKSCAQIKKLAPSAAKKAGSEGLLWIAYPKKSSKKYQSDVGRDDSFSAFGKLSYEKVRMVALDDDWSAVRLKAAAHIKTLTRRRETCDSALGKRKATATAKAMKVMKMVKKK
ncbi:unnamed protein product [Durusdinium trenchii]|uniref:DUF3052 domain-containing protein n=2 Tax=Durusdinium trenchii TaxID=1381693 RepID=A0ABP0NRT6_9DINO